jgi:hypothetical protein
MFFAIVIVFTDEHMDMIGAIRNVVVDKIYNFLHCVILSVSHFSCI